MPDPKRIEPDLKKQAELPPLIECRWCRCWIPKAAKCKYCDGPQKGEKKIKAHRLQFFRDMMKKNVEEWKAGAWKRVGVPFKYRGATLADFGKKEKKIRDALFSRTWVFAGGPFGTGKSHLLAACIRETFVWGRRVRWAYTPDFISELIRDAYGDGFNVDDVVEPYTHTYDLLALDDFGKGKITERAEDFLRRIVNGRYNQGLPMVISSNLTLKEIGKRFADLAGRIHEEAVQIPLKKVRKERQY